MKGPGDRLFIGTAGWSLPKAEQAHFPACGSHLERYGARFRAVEINSSFHRSHKPLFWARWRDAVPADFQFSVKVPKAITHTARLADTTDLVAAFLDDVSTLEAKLGCLLVQLPPSLGFEAPVATAFFKHLRAPAVVPIACEPRHASWFTKEVDERLRDLNISRVAADPARVPEAAIPGGARQFKYFRLHGSPKVYYSSYPDEFIRTLSDRLRAEAVGTDGIWCIFDNTTLGAATRNALDLSTELTAGV